MECSLHALQPLEDVTVKLEAEHKHQKEKAEKIAKSLIDKTVKESIKATAKKKGGNKRKMGGGDNVFEEVSIPQQTAEEKLKRAQEIEEKGKQDQDKLDEMLKLHSEKFQAKQEIPLTKMASVEDRSARSARAVLMQQAAEQAKALRAEAEAVPKAEPEASSHPFLGVQAAVQAARAMQESKDPKDASSSSTRKGKGKGKGSGSDAKLAAATDMKKLGKHVLK